MNHLHIAAFVLAFTTSLIAKECTHNNIVIFSISTPRSCSTAFGRMFEARGDCLVMHELSMRPHDLLFFSPAQIRHLYTPDAPSTFDEVMQMIFKGLKKGHVLAKEISFSVQEFLHNHNALVCNPVVHFVFLVRNPHHTIISFFKKKDGQVNGNIGYKSLYEELVYLKKNAFNPPLIVFAEDLYNYPYEVARQLYEKLGISYKEESLHWESIESGSFDSKNWVETKGTDTMIAHWHDAAMKSTGFTKPTQYEVDANGNPTFSEIADEKDRERCKEIYREELFYYTLIQLEYENICQPTPPTTL